MCEVHPTYEAAEGNVRRIGHLRVEDTLQLFQNSQLVCDARFIGRADVHDGNIAHDSARGPFKLKMHFQNKLNVAKSRKQLLNDFAMLGNCQFSFQKRGSLCNMCEGSADDT